MINYKGTLLPEDSPIFDARNRGFTLGDAVYEEIKAVNGQLYFWEDHYLRLMASMRILRMEIPMNFTLEYLEEQIQDLLKANELQDKPAFVKIYVYRESGSQLLPEGNEVAFTITTETGKQPFYTLPEAAYELELFKDFYINADMLSNLNTNNHILSVVGSIFARENGYQDCFLLNAKKNVVSALNGNIFLVQGKQGKTPPLGDGCKDGIVRKKLLGILKNSEHYQVREESISPFELQKADGLFITNIRVGILPVTKYRKAEYSGDLARELIGKLNAAARLG
ncbi:MAG: aminotransferase class IV [Eudoraea sp.]|nr:aminotransferase class IV [Eudoraea sp.]NNJ40273.1 aminotransferase class IV [Eudoraea sp.]